MGDLKSPFNEPAMPPPGLEGDTVISRGSDPNVDLGGSSGLKPVWDDPFAGSIDGQETANGISGLPSLPNRSEPSAVSEEPPDLTDRSPGTIDRK